MTVKFRPPKQAAGIRSFQLADAARKSAQLGPGESFALYGSPGSGKTVALMARYLALTDSGVSPDRIAVISATREAANTLRDLLALELQGATTGPIAKTITSLAFALLTEGARKESTNPPQLLTGSEQDRLIEEILLECPRELWPKAFDAKLFTLSGFRTELRDLLAVAQEYRLAPEQIATLAPKQFPQWQGFSWVYKNYLASLGQLGKVDASNLLVSAAELIRAASKAGQPPKFDAVLIDDAQELTPAGSQFVLALSEGGAGVGFYGDPDSATLGFRIANPKAMGETLERIGEQTGSFCQRFYLEPLHAVRRPEISSVLARVSSQIEVARAGRQRKGLVPPKELILGDGVDQQVFLSRSDELAYVAKQLRRRHLFDSVPWSEMAVVARSRETLEKIALALAGEGVPVRVVGSALPLKHEHGAGELLLLARLALTNDPISASDAQALLCTEFGGFDSISLHRLRRSMRLALGDNESSAKQLLELIFSDPLALESVPGPLARSAQKLALLIADLRRRNSSGEFTVEGLLWELFDGTGLRSKWLELARGVSEVAIQANRNLDSVLALFASAARYSERNPANSAADFVFDQLAREVPEDTLALRDEGERVSLLTPSGLIGRRYDTVAIPELLEGVWPNLKLRSSLMGAKLLDLFLRGEIEDFAENPRTELSDELRMFNKAVGACSNLLILTASDLEDEQVSQFMFLAGTPGEPRRYRERGLTLAGVTGALRREVALGAGGTEITALARLALAGVPGAHPDHWYGLLPPSTTLPLTKSTEQVVINPSQLENFLKCPLHWFLDSHGGKRDSFQASLGTLIHGVLEEATSSEIEQLEKRVDSVWHTLEFESDWVEKSERRKASRMLMQLSKYLQSFEAEGGKVIGVEELFEFELDGVKVRGKVDRIEQLSDGSVVIVDLKTGSQIPSYEEASNHAQLGLYQLAYLKEGFLNLPASGVLREAKLLLVGGNSLTQRDQPAFDEARVKDFEQTVTESALGMAGNYFVAQLDSHCSQRSSYGSCQLHLVRAVSNAG